MRPSRERRKWGGMNENEWWHVGNAVFLGPEELQFEVFVNGDEAMADAMTRKIVDALNLVELSEGP